MRKTLSVIIPNYNMAHLLPEALDSVLSQTFTNFEIIIVDDASQDDSLVCIANYQKKCSCLHLLKNETNLGSIASINRGIKEAKGKYLFFLAADDLLLTQDFFAIAIKELEANPSYSFCTTDHAMFIDGKSEIHHWKIFRKITEITCVTPPDFLHYCITKKLHYWLFFMGSVFRRELFVHHAFNADFLVLSDWYLVHLFALQRGFIYLPKPCVAWRHRGKENQNYKMKKLEIWHLLAHISANKDERRLFIQSTLLKNYLKQIKWQLLLQPKYWDFLYPFILPKIKRTIRGVLGIKIEVQHDFC